MERAIRQKADSKPAREYRAAPRQRKNITEVKMGEQHSSQAQKIGSKRKLSLRTSPTQDLTSASRYSRSVHVNNRQTSHDARATQRGSKPIPHVKIIDE